jgi:hypothetical protein
MAIRAAFLVPPAPRPFRVNALPKDLDLSAPSPSPLEAVTGVGGDDMELRTVDLATGGGTFMVAGPSRSGRSTMLAAMARSLLVGGTSIVVVAPRQGPVRGLAGLPGVRAVFTGDDVTVDELSPCSRPTARRSCSWWTGSCSSTARPCGGCVTGGGPLWTTGRDCCSGGTPPGSPPGSAGGRWTRRRTVAGRCRCRWFGQRRAGSAGVGVGAVLAG